MLIVLLFVFVALILLGVKLCYDGDYEFGGGACCTIGTLFSLGCLIGICVGIGCLVNLNTIDAQIALHEDENKRIEAQVETTVNHYLEYEKGIIDNINIDEYDGERLLLISGIYPDLKANEMLKQQIELYIQNSESIRQMKLSKIKVENWKFWLYFGEVGV